MIIKEVIKFLDDWAPPGAAWDKDNPGLQVGNPDTEVTNILLSLDASEEIVREAIARQCNLIITHHPLLYHSIKKINTAHDSTSRIITALLKNDITLLSYHTNLDFTKEGVNYKLAELLGLQNIAFLKPLSSSLQKLIVYVPEEHCNSVASSLYAAGAGNIGEYSHCSFRSSGSGTFMGSENAHPAIGEKLVDETVAEVRLEVVFDAWIKNSVVKALFASHPYEEPAFDIVQLENENTRYGSGVIGDLAETTDAVSLLRKTAEVLNVQGIRYTNGKSDSMKRIAVCGGSGSDLLQTALAKGADALITGDVSYHTFQSAENRLMLIDAGHYETEFPILKTIKNKLIQYVTERNCISGVFETTVNTNPVKFYK